MDLAQIKLHLSPQDYYRIERDAEFKSEYFDGEMFAMAGGSMMHSLVGTNVTGALRAALTGGRCRAFNSDLRVKVKKTGLRVYPDATVICGPIQVDPEDDQKETATNPSLIVEVLSKSTETYDRGTKFEHYQSIETLMQYVLVSQHAPKVETYLRQADGTWRYEIHTGFEATARLDALEISLTLADVYAGVEFEEPPHLRVVVP